MAGLFIPWMIERFSYFDRFGWWYAGIGLAMLALVFVIGVERYGAKNWIQIGGFAMQPSEFVKIIFVFFVAALLARSVQFVDVVKVSVAAAAHVLILVVQKDLGAALIFFITYVIVLYVASQNSLYLISALAAGTLAAVVAWRLFHMFRFVCLHGRIHGVRLTMRDIRLQDHYLP